MVVLGNTNFKKYKICLKSAFFHFSDISHIIILTASVRVPVPNVTIATAFGNGKCM